MQAACQNKLNWWNTNPEKVNAQAFSVLFKLSFLEKLKGLWHTVPGESEHLISLNLIENLSMRLFQALWLSLICGDLSYIYSSITAPVLTASRLCGAQETDISKLLS